jgi:predicted flap endonuclease-1-like 5' DNA nuclease
MIEANWVAFALALVIGLLVAWWLFGRTAKGESRARRPDVLDEGAAPAQRNQALIDAPSAAAAATAPPPATTAASFAGAGPDIMGGIGEIIGAAAAEEVADAAPPRAAEPDPPAIEADDLLLIKGLGPKLVTLLGGLGVTRYAQIAAWSEADIDRIDPQLGAFAGRIRRDNWVEQAKFLAAGDRAGFEGKFGKI